MELIAQATFKLVTLKTLNPGTYLFPVLKTGTAPKTGGPCFFCPAAPAVRHSPHPGDFGNRPEMCAFCDCLPGFCGGSLPGFSPWNVFPPLKPAICVPNSAQAEFGGFGLRRLVSNGFLGAKAPLDPLCNLPKLMESFAPAPKNAVHFLYGAVLHRPGEHPRTPQCLAILICNRRSDYRILGQYAGFLWRDLD